MKKTREVIQDEAVQAASKYKRRGLVISMRVGKTRIGLRVAKEKYYQVGEDVKILITTPKLSIQRGWKDEIVKMGLEWMLPFIEFSTYRSLHKKAWDYDLVILDESHSILKSHVPFLRSLKGDILGLTGTPPTWSTSDKGQIATAYFPTVYEYKLDQAVEANILNDYRVIVHLVPLSSSNILPVQTNKSTFYTSEQKSYDFWTKKITEAASMAEKSRASIMRMKTMQKFTSKEQYALQLIKEIEDDKCIIFADSKEQADRLCKHTYHSGNKDSEANLELLKSGEIDKLAAVLQISEGITIKDLKSSIIIHGYANENKFTQRFARCLSLNPDELATVHLLAYEGTVDADKWVPQSLEQLDPTKIKYVKYNYR